MILDRSVGLHLDENTPLLVYDYLYKIMRIKGGTPDIIKTFEYDTVPDDMRYNEEHLSKIAQYVSSYYGDWNFKALKIAFKQLIKFKKQVYIERDYTIGEKTPSDPLSYDILMIYKLCLKMKIELTKDETIYTMNKKIQQKLFKTENKIDVDTQTEKIEYKDMNIQTETEDVEMEMIEEEEEVYPRPEKDINYFIFKSKLSDEEAIESAGVVYSIDISSSRFPKREIKEIAKSKKYIPVDEIFRKNYLINKSYYNVKKFYKPWFNDFYTDDDISSLLSREGVEGGQNELYYRSYHKNFYCGKIPGIVTATVSLEPLEEAEGECISYGSILQKKMIVFTLDELIRHFKVRDSFADPLDEGYISDEAMEKLIMICSGQNNHEYDELQQMINVIENKTKLKSANIKNLELEACDPTKKQHFIDYFKRLFELGMYMRGWKIDGTDDFPLTSEMCNSASTHADEIQKNIGEHYSKLNELYEGLEESERNVIRDLPLIKINSLKNLYISNNQQEGLTIGERLNIIFNDTDNVYACIRMSSNYLISSANYYTHYLKEEELINLRNLDLIS
jgi:hypothetical protein